MFYLILFWIVCINIFWFIKLYIYLLFLVYFVYNLGVGYLFIWKKNCFILFIEIMNFWEKGNWLICFEVLIFVWLLMFYVLVDVIKKKLKIIYYIFFEYGLNGICILFYIKCL